MDIDVAEEEWWMALVGRGVVVEEEAGLVQELSKTEIKVVAFLDL